MGRKQMIVGKGKKEREIAGRPHIIYAEVPGGGGCDCSWTEDAFWIFKTKKEADSHVEYPPFGYLKQNSKVVKITINY